MFACAFVARDAKTDEVIHSPKIHLIGRFIIK